MGVTVIEASDKYGKVGVIMLASLVVVTRGVEPLAVVEALLVSSWSLAFIEELPAAVESIGLVTTMPMYPIRMPAPC